MRKKNNNNNNKIYNNDINHQNLTIMTISCYYTILKLNDATNNNEQLKNDRCPTCDKRFPTNKQCNMRQERNQDCLILSTKRTVT